MNVFDNAIKRRIAGIVALVGALSTALLVVRVGGEMSPFQYTFLIATFFGFLLLLLSLLVAKSPLAQMRFPRSLATWGRNYVLLLALWFVVGVFGPIAVSPSLNLSDLPWLAGYGLLSLSVYGLVAFVAVVIPVWGLVQLARAAYRRYRRPPAEFRNGNV